MEDESNGSGAARNENLEAEETKKLTVSLAEAAAKIDPSGSIRLVSNHWEF